MSPRPARRRKRPGRRRSAPARAPYIERRIGSVDILSEEGLCLIEGNADAILRDVGMEFRGDPEILDLWRDAGMRMLLTGSIGMAALEREHRLDPVHLNGLRQFSVPPLGRPTR